MSNKRIPSLIVLLRFLAWRNESARASMMSRRCVHAKAENAYSNTQFATGADLYTASFMRNNQWSVTSETCMVVSSVKQATGPRTPASAKEPREQSMEAFGSRRVFLNCALSSRECFPLALVASGGRPRNMMLAAGLRLTHRPRRELVSPMHAAVMQFSIRDEAVTVLVCYRRHGFA